MSLRPSRKHAEKQIAPDELQYFFDVVGAIDLPRLDDFSGLALQGNRYIHAGERATAAGYVVSMMIGIKSRLELLFAGQQTRRSYSTRLYRKHTRKAEKSLCLLHVDVETLFRRTARTSRFILPGNTSGLSGFNMASSIANSPMELYTDSLYTHVCTEARAILISMEAMDHGKLGLRRDMQALDNLYGNVEEQGVQDKVIILT